MLVVKGINCDGFYRGIVYSCGKGRVIVAGSNMDECFRCDVNKYVEDEFIYVRFIKR